MMQGGNKAWIFMPTDSTMQFLLLEQEDKILFNKI
jgi:hypothetical protein